MLFYFMILFIICYFICQLNMTISILSIISLLLMHTLVFGYDSINDVGYRIGNVSGYQLISQSGSSKLYKINCPQLDDGRPLRMVVLEGSHYQVGYDYGAMLALEVRDTFNKFMGAEFDKKWKKQFLKLFLSWQYDSYVEKHIPSEFKEQIRGIHAAAVRVHNITTIRSQIQQTLVITSYPGDFGSDILYALVDQFLRQSLIGKNQILLNIVEANLFQAVKFLKKFLNKKRIHCSFFALWGNRTEGGKLVTMRNLDWQANTGINIYKTLFVWKVTGTIPHVTFGFPILIGALTGMSKAGLTVHEAGLDSMRETQLGFQWSLRLRYILMHASNLQEAKKIWEQTNNTLGMNHMIASASDLITNHPAYVMQTMRNYTAWFIDNDERQNETMFIDPITKEKFRAGFSMKQAVFRTNHAYDPKINKFRTALPGKSSSTVKRYLTLKDGIEYYENINKKISNEDAINITASTAHKGGNNPHQCPGYGDNGTNVISAVFLPASLEVYIAFEYGGGEKYKTACCGVYVHIKMQQWLK